MSYEHLNKLNAILDSSPDAIMIISLKGTITDCSSATVLMHGFDNKEELIGKSVFSLIHEENSNSLREGYEEAKRSGRIHDKECVFLRKDGTEFEAELSFGVIRDERGDPTGFIGVAKDISARKRAERALRESEEKLRAMFDSVGDGITVADMSANLIDVNEAAVRLHGNVKKSELIGVNCFTLIKESELEYARSVFEELIEKGSVQNKESVFLRKDGSEFPIEISMALLRNESGKPVGFVALTKDISERKNAERQLRESEERYRRLAENLGKEYFFYRHNREGVFTFLSSSITEMLGYSKEEFMKHYSEYMTDDPVNLNVDRYTELCLAGKLQPTYEVEVFHKDGRRKLLEVTETPVCEESGEVVAVEGIAHDITAKKAIENELRESEEKYRALVETTNTGYLILDWEGRVLDANPEYVRLTGRKTLDDIKGHRVIEWTATYDIQRNESEVERCVKTGEVRGLEIDYIDEAGHITPVEINAKIVETKEGKRILSLCRDIAPRKQRDRELQESEERFRLTFENARDAIVWIDSPTEKIINCNKGAEMLFEYSRDELIGSHFTIVHPPEIREFHRKMFAETMRKPPEDVGELELMTKSGRRMPAHISVTLHRIGDSVIVQGIFREMTDFKRMQAEKEQLMEQLHQSQKMEAIGLLAGGIAHDFNNILAVIIGSSELVEKGLPEGDKKREHIERISRVAKRAKDLTMNLLTFARKEKLEVRPIDAGQLISELIDLLTRSLPKKIRMESICATEETQLSADVNQILQALLNVCINAADAMPDGGTLTISSEDVELGRRECGSLTGVEPGRYCRIAITDTGHGMTPEEIEKVFTPFYTTKERGKGTGLGMSITQGIVHNHGGDIRIESEPGKGTTVTIFLPAAEPTEKTEDALDMKRRERVLSGTVLIVDDDCDFLDMTAEILRENGLTVIPAPGPLHALDFYSKHKMDIDVVILDMMMPEMSGEEVFRLLRKDNPHLKIILCSGFSGESEAGRIIKEGVSVFLQKPFDSETLLQLVSDML